MVSANGLLAVLVSPSQPTNSKLYSGVAVRTRLLPAGYWPDPGLTVRGLLGILNWTLTWYSPNGEKSIEQIADEYSDFVLRGMLK